MNMNIQEGETENNVIDLETIDDGFQIVSRTKVHRIKSFQKKDIKKKSVIDLTIEDHQPKSIKKTNSIQKKTNPFDKLGKQANDIVNQLIEKYKLEFRKASSKGKSSIQQYNENVKECISMYLLYGFVQLHLNDPNQVEFQKTKNQILQKVFQISSSIQRGLYQQHGKNIKIYQSKCKIIVDNLKDFTNFQLRSKVLLGTISPYEVSIASQTQLQSTQRKQVHQQKLKYLLAESDLIKTSSFLQSNMIQQKELINEKQSMSEQTTRNTQFYRQLFKQKFQQLQNLMSRVQLSFRLKINKDLPEDFIIDFEAQLSYLQL